LRKEPEPLTELLYQEFPNTDPIEIERITKVVKKWLEQKRKWYEKAAKKVAKELGEKATPTYVTKAYPHCVDDLLREIDPQKYPIHT